MSGKALQTNTDDNYRQSYRAYVRPKLADRLRAVRLDTVFHRAEGDKLYYYDNEIEVSVNDFIGGFGSCLFGHNYAPFKETMQTLLSENIPMHAQLSTRSGTAALAEKLNGILKKRFDKDFCMVFANSGSECVEIALKHAHMAFHNRLRKLHQGHRQMLSRALHSSADILISRQLKDWYQQNCLSTGHFETIPKRETLIHIGNQLDQRYRALFLDDHHPVRYIRPTVISLQYAYHGHTAAARHATDTDFAVSDDEHFRKIASNPSALIETLDHLSHTYSHLCFNTRGELSITKSTICVVSAVIVEPIQGEGGIRPLSPVFLQACRCETKKRHVSLVFDEIQSGLGRCGSFIYSECLDVPADAILLGKSLGGGLTKIAVCALTRETYQHDFSMKHYSTFAEDCFSARIAVQVLEQLGPPLYEQIKMKGQRLKKALQALQTRYPSIIKDVRGQGLMIGIEWQAMKETSPVIAMLEDQGLLTFVFSGYLFHEHNIRVVPALGHQQTMRIEPSVFIDSQTIDRFIFACQRLCQILVHRNAYPLLRFMVGGEIKHDLQPIPCFTHPDKASTSPNHLRKVAFLGHMINSNHLELWDKSFCLFSDSEKDAFFDVIHRITGPYLTECREILSSTGESVVLYCIFLPINSRLLHGYLRNRDLKMVREKVDQGVALASRLGCQVIGLGGFTSIVTGNGRHVTRHNISVTTGNSLTVAMGIAAIQSEALKLNISIADSTVAIVGACGNIGRIYAQLLSQKSARLLLVGRRGRKHALEKLSDQLDATVKITTDIQSLTTADIIIVATNAPTPFIFASMLKSTPVIICDLSVPSNVATSVTTDKDNVTVIKGGIVSLPFDNDFVINGIPLSPGHIFACMAETLVLGLENYREDFSLGAVEAERVARIQTLASRHGFSLGHSKTIASY